MWPAFIHHLVVVLEIVIFIARFEGLALSARQVHNAMSIRNVITIRNEFLCLLN